MTNTIFIGETAWYTTFPHLVRPLQDEWLPGLLLRCDELNRWESRTALTHVLAPGPEKFHRCWRTGTPNLIVIQPSSLNLSSLAELLATSTQTLLAATYHLELSRLYETFSPHPKLLNRSYVLQICPQCLAEQRLLQRRFTLPSITLCPQHQIVLQKECLCGTQLHLFHRFSQPFCCSNCGRDWGDLPRIQASIERVKVEQKFLSWYEYFFSEGTPRTYREAMLLANGLPLKHRQEKRSKLGSKRTGLVGDTFSLGVLVNLLVKRGILPEELRRGK